ncbi:MAG: tRNA (pseudouridine(54)-N(1))-methyltransferase TrmY [Archaeoglobi archaeon]|nr:tRNA (pseudouridine(54)-N(1))-methyltransferase TrmY [Archaeoglobi archaeon]
MSRTFVIIASKAVTTPFNLNDLAGSAGRMDLVCRFISQSLFISHGVRRDSTAYAVLKGPPEPVKILRFEGGEVRYLAPDERNIAGMINKALKAEVRRGWTRVSPGVYVSRMGLADLLEELSERGRIYYLREDGVDVDGVELINPVFVAGDHTGVSPEDEEIILERCSEIVSLGKVPYQADQCVTILNYLLDRRAER